MTGECVISTKGRDLSFTKLSICCSYGDTPTSIGAPFLRPFDSSIILRAQDSGQSWCDNIAVRGVSLTSLPLDRYPRSHRSSKGNTIYFIGSTFSTIMAFEPPLSKTLPVTFTFVPINGANIESGLVPGTPSIAK